MALLLTTTLTANITVSPGKPTMYVDPDLITQSSGLFTIEIKAANVTSADSLFGWQFSLHFNPGLLEITRARRGSFLRDAVTPQSYTTIYRQSRLSDANFLGVLHVGESVYPKMPPDPPYPPVGAVGDGTLAEIEFNIKGPGICPLDLEDTKLLTVVSSTPIEISHNVADGVFDNRLVNVDPVANIVVTAPPPAVVGELLQFDGSSSTDDGWIVSYEWDFDYDGMTFDVDATGDVVFHAYDVVGTYTAALRVTDNDGATDIGDQIIQVLTWMEGGTFPDLVMWEAKAEKPKWYEATDGQNASFNARVGNPTSEDFEVYVEFTLHSKDEAKLLGTIETLPQTISGGDKITLTAYLDITDSTWACFSGSPEWVGYGYYGGGGMRKYAVFARCYYNNGTGPKVGNVVKYFHFNVLPVSHDIGVDMWTTATNVTQGGTLDIYANITNYGDLSETFVVNVTYKGEFAEGIVEQRLVTVAAETTAPETFSWDTTSLPLGPYIIKVTLPVLTYEYPRDTGNQEDLTVVTIV